MTFTDHGKPGRTSEWGTPQDVFDALDAEFHFTLDPCAAPWNAKCKKFYTKEQDGLAQPWAPERVFMNPPYGKNVIDKWVKKAHDESLKGVLVVCLLPANVETGWFQDYIYHVAEIRFPRGRINFIAPDGKKGNGSNHASMFVIFRPPAIEPPCYECEDHDPEISPLGRCDDWRACADYGRYLKKIKNLE